MSRKKPPRTVSQRNPVARALRSPHLRQQKLPTRKPPTNPDWDDFLDEVEELEGAIHKYLGEI